MTRAEVIVSFKENILPQLEKNENGKPDYAMRAEEWGIFTDALCKSGDITLKQYETWDAPSFCRKI